MRPRVISPALFPQVALGKLAKKEPTMTNEEQVSIRRRGGLSRIGRTMQVLSP